jgi:hypothetical protein
LPEKAVRKARAAFFFVSARLAIKLIVAASKIGRIHQTVIKAVQYS